MALYRGIIGVKTDIEIRNAAPNRKDAEDRIVINLNGVDEQIYIHLDEEGEVILPVIFVTNNEEPEPDIHYLEPTEEE